MKNERKFLMKKTMKNPILKCFASIFAVFLLNSCATVLQRVQINPEFQSMLQPQGSNERVIARVDVSGSTRNCTGEDQHPSSIPMGRDITGLPGLVPRGGHPDEDILDRLLILAQRQFPGEHVAIRNATRGVRHVIGEVDTRNVLPIHRMICQYHFFADVVITAPMPQPVTHSEHITITEGQIGNIIASDGSVLGQISSAQVTRGDMYRRVHNWLTDANPRGSVEIRAAQFELGRISGRYYFVVRGGGGQDYTINSTFTIDIHDASAQIRFENTVLRRSALIYHEAPVIVWVRHAPVLPRIFDEAIFLQSIADSAHAELVNFTNALILM